MPNDDSFGLPPLTPDEPVLTDPVVEPLDTPSTETPPAPTFTPPSDNNQPSSQQDQAVSTSQNDIQPPPIFSSSTNTENPSFESEQSATPPPTVPITLDFPRSSQAEATPPSLPTPPTSIPASLPTARSTAPVLLLGVLVLMCFASIASATYFWLQNQTLISQINAIQSTLAQRQTDITPIPTPTTDLTPTPTQVATPSASTFGAFQNMTEILTLARTESPTAQMLMISGENLHSPSTTSYRYWFRRGPTTKSYFFIHKEANTDPQLFAQASITPDNNIPDLIPSLEAGQGGVDSSEALELIQTKFLNAYAKDSIPTSVTVKYLMALPNDSTVTNPILLWQFSYRFAATSNVTDVTVQLDATSKEIVFTSQPAQ